MCYPVGGASSYPFGMKLLVSVVETDSLFSVSSGFCFLSY